MTKTAAPTSSEVELSKKKLRLLSAYHQYREQGDAIQRAWEGVAEELRQVDAELRGYEAARTGFAKTEEGEG